MSEREPNFRADPQDEPIPAPVAEIEAEIKAEIAAEMEAEPSRGEYGPGGYGTGYPDGYVHESAPGGAHTAGEWPDPPPPVADPAAEVLAWLRGEFDDLNATLQNLSNRLSRQEEAVLRVTGSQEAELNSTLAELEGSSAQLRNEAATLRDTRSELAGSLPRLVTEAVQSAIAGTMSDAVKSAIAAAMADAVTQMQGTVAQLGAALAEALPAAVAEAVASSPTVPTEEAADDHESGADLVTQLHDAQDEAAEWFTLVVDEAVRKAADRWLAPAAGSLAAGVGKPTAPTTSAGGSGTAGAERVSEPPPPRLDPTTPAAPEAVSEVVLDDATHREEPATGPGPEGAGTAVEAITRQPGTDVDPLAVSGSDEPAAAAGSSADSPESGIACLLPGVTVGPTLAMGVSTALGRARLRRRRRRPASAPAAGLFRHDPYAGELSQRLERFALARRDLAWRPEPASADSANGHARPSTSVRVVVAERDGQEVAVDLGAGPLALAGPDADDAGRALVATFLTADHTSTGRVVVADDLLPPGPPFPGLDRFADLSSALDGLESEIIARAGRPSGAGGTEHPAVVLVTPTPPPDLGRRLERVAERGAACGVTAVVVGAPTARGAADLAGARMFGLSLGAMSEVLGVLAAARSDDEPAQILQVQSEPFPVLTASGPAPIQVRVLGPYRIDVGGEEIRSGLRAKAKELLAFYLLHPEGTTLDVATEALWPEADPGRGSEWFWTALGNLRSRLRSVTGTKALKIIERDGDRYRIEGVFDVDLWRFQAALPPPGASTGDPKWAAALQGAADMYDGELLSGVDWAWADVPREDLRRRAVDVLVSLGATRLVAGDVRGALDVLSHAVEVDPVAEQVYRRIMRLHAKQSRPDEVQATFERLKVRLASLGLEPTPESEQLAKELVG